ncbi:hypothetical protein [Streptomyces prunicolor]|uniref:hypothetical protein n=1 Tax=Streptomyces prunicolor TaxID=67348 RepID=UPI0033CAEAA6
MGLRNHGDAAGGGVVRRAVDTASGLILGERLRGGGAAARSVLHESAPDTRPRLLSRANTSAESASWPESTWAAPERTGPRGAHPLTTPPHRTP